jgi:hypothetical protein
MGKIAGLPVAVFVILLVLFILADVGITLGVIIYILRGRVRQAREMWAAQGIVIRRGPEFANYEGRASARASIRGNAALALTEHDLRLVQIMPRREFVIPLVQITQIEQHRAWKGHYRAGRPIIVVYYRDGSQQDAIGFSVRDTQGWLELISAASGVTVPPPSLMP